MPAQKTKITSLRIGCPGAGLEYGFIFIQFLLLNNLIGSAFQVAYKGNVFIVSQMAGSDLNDVTRFPYLSGVTSITCTWLIAQSEWLRE